MRAAVVLLALGAAACGDNESFPAGIVFEGPGSRGLVVAGDYLYFATYVDGGDGRQEGIRRMAIAGGYATPLWLGRPDEVMTAAPVVAGAQLVWAESGGVVRAMPLAGGGVTTLATLPSEIHDLAGDGDAVYAATSSQIFRIGAPEPMYETSELLGPIALRSGTLYVVQGSASGDTAELWRVGSTNAKLAATPKLVGLAVDPTRILVDDDAAYVPTSSGVARVALADGTITTLGHTPAYAVAEAGGAVFAVIGQQPGQIAIARYDGDAETPLLQNLPYVGSLAGAGNRLYYSEAEYSQTVYGAIGFLDP